MASCLQGACSSHGGDGKRDIIGVFGNLEGIDMFNTATAWLRTSYQLLWPILVNVYVKGSRTFRLTKFMWE
eukprot:7231635-Pyramimonas_sp.AAC.1